MCRETHFKKVSYCTCGMYMRVNNTDPHYVYIDFCETRELNRENIKLKYYNHIMYEKEKFLDLECSQRISNEDNLDEWNSVPLENKYFKCANVSSEFCQTYVVRTSVNTDLTRVAF